MKLLNVPFLLFSFSFIGGISLGFFVPIQLDHFLIAYTILFILFLLAYGRAKKQFFPDHWFGIIALLTAIATGFLATQLQLPKNQKHHYLSQLQIETTTQHDVRLLVTEVLKPSRYQQRYITTVEQLDGKPSSGKILFVVQKDSIKSQIGVGSHLLVEAPFQKINSPLNPFQFDYQKYMKEHEVYREIRSNPSGVFLLDNADENLAQRAEKFRNFIHSRLNYSGFSKTQVAFMEALVLGQKKELDREIYQNFADAGVVHVLAVSGLHVGMILLFLNFLANPFKKKGFGKIVVNVIIIILLWAYAYLTGFRPSILRAVTMFSFVQLGLLVNRKSFTLNILLLSAVFLLLFQPYFIFDVGFQLSYSAVLSIVCFQPFLLKIFYFHNYFASKLWSIATLTLTAQLGVLPLSLFYFHQFPLLFFVSNLVIIPFIGLMLAGSILSMLLSCLGFMFPILITVFGFLIDSLLWFVQLIAAKSDFLITNIYFSISLLIGAYLVLLFLIFYLYQRKTAFLFLFLVGILGWESAYIFQQHQLQQVHKFYVFQRSRQTLLGLEQGQTLQLYGNQEEKESVENSGFLKSFLASEGIQQHHYSSEIKNLYFFRGKYIFVIDKNGVSQLTDFQPDYIILRNSPKINLDRLLDVYNPIAIIADGSNYKSYVVRWRKTCSIKKAPFHSTSKKGAFVIDY